MLTPASTVAMLGFGARASVFAALLAPRGCALRAWDPRLALPDASIQRARIEAAGVDAFSEPGAALRGARLVVVDGMTRDLLAAMPLQIGQKVLDLAAAPAAEIDAVLAALGLPAGQTNWEAACAARNADMADSAAASEPPAVPRGELP